jgi:serine/threonine-protein kinase
MSDGDDAAKLKRRAAELAHTIGLPVGATITARTLMREEAPPAPPAALPRISVDQRDLGAAVPLAPGGRDYTIRATIGEGGMGRVQLARQRSLERDVALKTLKPDAGPAIAEALLREARLTGSLEHPGVIPVHALGVDEAGRPVLVMKRIDGVDLSLLLKDPAHPAWRGRSSNRLVAALEILTQVCLTLEFAHSRGVIHRDIKPENIMVGGFGEVYLLDFGIATSLGEDTSRALVGTPAYLAPEMVLGEPVTVQTDVYLLGATLHEILTGRCRHQADQAMDALRLAVESAPYTYDAGVPEELARLCNRATARRPSDRPANVAELREAIADFLRHRTARALCDAAAERLGALEQLLAAAGEAVPADLAQAYRLCTEARFGLTQSLREHPADEAARRAMQRCLVAAIDLELRQGHADTADALLRELETPDPALQRRIADTRASTEERARERARLEALERDLDPSENAGDRSRGLLLATLAVAGITGLVLARGGTPTPMVALLASVGAFTLIGGATLFLRRKVLTNAFNRRMAAALIVAIGGTLLHRALNVFSPEPIDVLFSEDLVLLVTVTAVASVTVLRRLWTMAVPLVGGICAMRLWPDRSPLAFGMSVATAMVVAALVLARTGSPRK